MPPAAHKRPEQLGHVQDLLGDRFVVERELGHGGMSYVYLAQDLQRNGPVAVKILRPEFAASLGAARFQREVDILRHLDHPHILPLYDSGSADGELYYTMPFVNGPTLRENLREEPQLPLEVAIAISRQVASALAYAHGQGVIHRDIKPSNILLDRDRAMIADFGIARAIDLASSDRITTSNFAIGTPEYMGPEQASGEQRLDGRADIYALGCVMYEMLAGEPPFTGPTAQAIVARQCHDLPRSLRVVRPSVPVGLQRLIMKALAKVPNDRYATANDLIVALDAVDLSDTTEGERPRPVLRWLVALGIIVAATAVGWWLSRAPPELDLNRIVVFPLHDQRATSDNGDGEGVATYIDHALNLARPLKSLAAWDLADDRSQDLSRLNSRTARRLSQRANAAYFIDGAILRRPDSITVALTLHDVRGDSVLLSALKSGLASADLPLLGLHALSNLLEAVVQPGQTFALGLLYERNPRAVANFLLGEREYRRMQFAAALDHYQAAVMLDSAFSVAAFKGAQAATWLSRPDVDTALINVALRREEYLTTPQAMLAKGLRAYLTGTPDSAVVLLQSALRADSTLPGAWALLGEVYARSLTSEPAADSLARVALRKARLMDRGFAPTLLLLEEIALRDSNLREARLRKAELRRAGADTTHASLRGLMWSCVEHGVTRVEWDSAAKDDASSTLGAGRVLARGVAQPACARAALAAVVRSESATPAQRRGALLGLNGLLIAGARMKELSTLMSVGQAGDLGLWQLYLQDAAIGAGFEREASTASDSVGTNYSGMPSPVLWFLAGWAARREAVPELREIARTARDKAHSTRVRRDSLIARLVEARLTLATGDTDRAIAQLQALKPSGARRDIAWRPWEGLGAERLLLAELLTARRKYRDAIRVASLLDAAEPVPYLLYIRPSLEVRLRATRDAGDAALAAQYAERLKRLER